MDREADLRRQAKQERRIPYDGHNRKPVRVTTGDIGERRRRRRAARRLALIVAVLRTRDDGAG